MFTVFVAFGGGDVTPRGHPVDYSLAGTGAFIALLAIQSVTIYIESHYITIVQHASIVGMF